MCDGLCGVSCLRKRCPQLIRPQNGNMVFDRNDRTIGTEVTYSCNDGYVITGHIRRICQRNQVWSGAQPICTESNIEATCPILEIENGNLAYHDENNQRVFEPRHGDFRVASCNKGRKLQGTSHTRCSFGAWQDELPSCRRVRCGHPPEVENSSHNGTKSHYNEGEVLAYRCSNGFYRTGVLPLATCYGDEWGEIRFQCTLVVCPSLDVPFNGRKIGSNYSYNNVVSFECNSHFILEGQRFLRCQENGSWNGSQPSCRLIQCPRPSSPLNGHSDTNLKFHGYQDTITFNCNHGYSLSGSEVITCNEDEMWSSPSPLCLAHCQLPPCPANWRWMISNVINCQPDTLVISGTRLSYRCNSGYFKCQQIEPVCYNGVWQSSIQNLCKPIGCTSPVLDDSRLRMRYKDVGRFRCSHPDYYKRGTVIKYSCQDGYKIREGDINQATCIGRSWEPFQRPTCVEVTCPPIQVINGGVRYQINGTFSSTSTHKAVAWAYCTQGYILVGPEFVICNNGEWNDAIGNCSEEPCPVSYFERYDVEKEFEYPSGSKLTMDGQKPAGTIARFICRQSGFEANQTKRCHRGRWIGGRPKCVLSQCLIPPCPSHGRWKIPDSSRCPSNTLVPAGTRLKYRCDDGFFKCQRTEPVCRHSKWEPYVQNLCEPIGCEKVTTRDSRLRAHYSFDGEGKCSNSFYYQRGATIEYSCNVGYRIRSRHNLQATCIGSSWEPSQQPTCVEVTCPIIPVANGMVRFQQNGSFSTSRGHNSTAWIFCYQGYMLVGPKYVFCNNGVWNNTFGTCIAEPCSLTYFGRYNMAVMYEVPPHWTKIEEGLKPAGTIATFICRQYGFESNQTKICVRGRWKGDEPECLRIPCIDERLANGNVTYTLDGAVYQEPVHSVMRTFRCNDGFRIENAESSVCDAGTWTGQLPLCSEIPCSKDDLVDDWKVVYNYPNGQNVSEEDMKQPGTVAKLTCNIIGYETVKKGLKTCRKGKWRGENPTCRRRQCRDVQLRNGRFEYRKFGNRVTLNPRHGDSRIAECDAGYHLQGTEESQCWNGKWEGKLPICKDAPCVEEHLANGIVTYTLDGVIYQDPVHGVMRTVHCNDGFRVDNEELSKCNAGTWSGQLPTCSEEPCRRDDLVDDWEVVYNYPNDQDSSEEAMKQSGTVAKLICNTVGYETVKKGLKTCRKGKWRGENPTCRRRPCRSIQLQNGRFEYRKFGNRITSNPRHGDSRVAECNTGYYLQGANESRCWNGQWEGKQPICKEDPCSLLIVPKYLQVTYSSPEGSRPFLRDGFYFFPSRSVATFTCTRQNTRMTGASRRTCKRGMWRGTFPEC